MQTTRKTPALIVAAAVLGLAGANAQAAAPALQSYNVDTDQVSVSGLSSGGFMAVQLHTVYSATFMGVGAYAGGVYHCAEGSQSNATGRCMSSGTLPSGNYFADIARNLATAGEIDPVANMAGDKVYLFHGTADSVVRVEASDRARDFYENFTASTDIYYSRDQLNVEHAMPTTDFGSSCAYKGSPYINDCDFDAAGEALQHIYSGLNAPVAQVTGNLLEFDQKAFTDSFYVGNTGYVYVPTACQQGVTCKLHVVLHGCKQNKDDIGDQYARHTGYNGWAEANDIIMLYPQTSTSATNSCWDWWGFADMVSGGQYNTKTGVHMQFVKAVLDHVSGGATSGGDTGGGTGGDSGGSSGGDTGSCTETSASNYAHVQAGRASTDGMNAFAVGSNDNLGYYNTFTTTVVAETSPGWYEQGTCAENTGSTGGSTGGDSGGSSGGDTGGSSGGDTGACTETTASNYAHVQAGRATTNGSYAYAVGSGANMGFYNTFTTSTLAETATGYYDLGSCP